MAITHSTAARNAAATAVTDLQDAQSPTPGDLRFLTAGAAEVAILPLSDPSIASVVAGVATYDAITSDTTTIAGTIDNFELRDGAGTVVISGTVTIIGGGGDIELTSITYANNETIGMSSLTYTAPV